MSTRIAAARPSPAQVRVLPPNMLAGRTALVTGAGTGIGRAIAIRLVDLGASVVGVGRRIDPLTETRNLSNAPDRLRMAALDIRDRDAAGEFVTSLGPIDLLVNNAGGQFIAPATAMSARGFGAVVDLNLTATASLIAAAHAGLAATGGRVVSLSLSAAERGVGGLSHSATARAAIVALTDALQQRWAGDGIRLFCLAPGTVFTSGVGDELSGNALTAAAEACLLGRDTSVEEVAEWVAAVGCGVFDAVGGTVLEIDGGAAIVDAPATLLRGGHVEPHRIEEGHVNG